MIKILPLSVRPEASVSANKALFFVVQQNKVLFHKVDNKILFTQKEIGLDFEEKTQETLLPIAKLNGNDIFVTSLQNPKEQLSDNFVYAHGRNVLDKIDEQLHPVLFRGFQLLNWHHSSLYCSCCSGKTNLSDKEFVKICNGCGHKSYPQYSPAVIMLVWRGDEILLSRSVNCPNDDEYWIYAGFLEAGETFEAAVHRELKEELNISVMNVQYHSVQPWPFPNSLMVAYSAEFKQGTIKIERGELKDAKWFHYRNLPRLAPSSTVSTKLIHSFVGTRLGYESKKKLIRPFESCQRNRLSPWLRYSLWAAVVPVAIMTGHWIVKELYSSPTPKAL